MRELYYSKFSLKMTYCLLQVNGKVSLALHFIDIKKCSYYKTLSIHFAVQIMCKVYKSLTSHGLAAIFFKHSQEKKLIRKGQYMIFSIHSYQFKYIPQLFIFLQTIFIIFFLFIKIKSSFNSQSISSVLVHSRLIDHPGTQQDYQKLNIIRDLQNERQKASKPTKSKGHVDCIG